MRPATDSLLLEIRNARVVRDGDEILHVEAFDLAAGERLAILGPNGAGKSTLIGIMTRDVLPVWAEPAPVRWRGDPRPEAAQVRRMLGVVSSTAQEMVRVHLTAGEVVVGGRFGALGVPPHLRAAVTQADVDAADRALREAGASHLAERDMMTLSTGEARRVLIARALVADPDVLVLDEPCAGLDPTAAWHLRALLRELGDSGRTLVLVTHHVEDVVAPFERVLMIKDGGIAWDGLKSQAFAGHRLRDLYGIDIEVEERGGEYRLW